MRNEGRALAEPSDLAQLRELPRWNCDCLPAGPDGQPSDDADAIYCERWVVLASDLDAALPALLARVSALTDQVASLRSDARALADAVIAVDLADTGLIDAGITDALENHGRAELWNATHAVDRALSIAVELARRVVSAALASEPQAKPDGGARG